MSWRGPVLAVVLMAVCVAVRFSATALEDLPLDSWMYAAMADDPRVFTARPWGYRLLGPLLVSLSPDLRAGFAALMAASLCGAGLALFLFLRQLGHTDAAALVGVLAFGASGPVAYSTRNPYLSEPLTVCLACVFLASLAARAPLGLIGLVATLGALSKEIFVGLLPLVFLVRRPARGARRALVEALLVATPALALTALLRFAWTPQLGAVWGLPGGAALPVLWERLGPGLLDPELLLSGVLPLALIGTLTAGGRSMLTTWAPLALVYTLLPFSAWLYDPRPGRLPFFGETVHRLLIYALPLLLPLALTLWPGARRPAEPRWPPGASRVGWIAAALVASLPLWALDDYRRGPLPERFNGPVIRALFAESLRVARVLDHGAPVSYDLDPAAWRRGTDATDDERESRRLARWERRPPARRAAQRFFLRGGWGSFPYLLPGPAILEGAVGELSLPAGRVRPLRLELTLSRGSGSSGSGVGMNLVRIEVAGAEVARFDVAAEATYAVVLESLVRGDNLVRVLAAPGLRLHALRLSPAGSRATTP